PSAADPAPCRSWDPLPAASRAAGDQPQEGDVAGDLRDLGARDPALQVELVRADERQPGVDLPGGVDRPDVDVEIGRTLDARHTDGAGRDAEGQGSQRMEVGGGGEALEARG